MVSQRTTVVGVFHDRDQAERALDELRRTGFGDDQVGFALRGGEPPADVEDASDSGTRAGEGAVTGMVTGGLIGGLLAAGASLLIPGVGPIIGGGILATVLGGAAAGAAAGGLIGALTGLGVPEEEARYYEGEFQSGRVIMTVRGGDRHDEAAAILRRNGAYGIDGELHADAAAQGLSQSTADPIDDVRRGSSVAEMSTGRGTPTHVGAIESERVHAYATHPISAALEDTATAAAGTPVTDRAARGSATPLQHPGEPIETTTARTSDIPHTATPVGQGTAGTGGMARDLAGSHAATGEGTTPVARGASGPPLQQHDRSAGMIYGRAEDESTAENRDATTLARRAAGAAEFQERTGADPDRASTSEEGRTAAERAVDAQHAGGQPGTSPAGRWPTRADDPQAGKLVEGEEQAASTRTPRPAEMAGQAGGVMRAPDAARGAPPYSDPADDLERVGATSGMASRRGTTWADASPRYRERWQARHGASGGRWEDAEPGYRYGHEMAADPRYQGRTWDDVRADLGAGYDDWSRRQGYQQGADGWGRMEQYARDAWDQAGQRR